MTKKTFHERLTSFCNKYSITANAQYGFRKGRSTKFALLAKKEFILELFKQKLLTLGVYIDFSKTFDHINHHTLLVKVNNYAIYGIPLSPIESY